VTPVSTLDDSVSHRAYGWTFHNTWVKHARAGGGKAWMNCGRNGKIRRNISQ